MKLYHGSETRGIEILEPRLADHERPYIYLSTLKIVAAFYLINAVERPYYWFPYGFDREGRVVYDELFPDALREAAAGRSGAIYEVEAREEDVLPFQNIPCARLGTRPMRVTGREWIPDCYAYLTEQERRGAFRLRRFEDKTPENLEWWYEDILSYIREKGMIHTPECSYARFVRRKFPWVWERYETLEGKGGK